MTETTNSNSKLNHNEDSKYSLNQKHRHFKNTPKERRYYGFNRKQSLTTTTAEHTRASCGTHKSAQLPFVTRRE